jgi:hypothetical protein
MSISIRGGNQHKAERVARDIVKNLTVMDIDWNIVESMGLEREQQLCAAVDEDFPKDYKRVFQLSKKITDAVNDDIDKLFEEHSDLCLRLSIARQKAAFVLGYFAALRLVGVTPKPKRK